MLIRKKTLREFYVRLISNPYIHLYKQKINIFNDSYLEKLQFYI